MGHSDASLYRKASNGWPFTKGSLGNMISWGVISAWELFLEVVLRAARVLARVRMKGLDDVVLAAGELDGSENPPYPGERRPEVSEVAEGERVVMGTMRPLRFESEALGLACADGLFSNSGGI